MRHADGERRQRSFIPDRGVAALTAQWLLHSYTTRESKRQNGLRVLDAIARSVTNLRKKRIAMAI